MKNLLSLLAAMAVAGTPTAQAQTFPAVDFTSPGQTANPGLKFNNIGWEFDAFEEVDVVALGFYDHNQDGLAASHPVGLFDSAGALLVWTNVEPADPLTGFFRYHAIPPFRLPPGIGYRISADLSGDHQFFARQVGGFSEHPSIGFVGGAFGAGAGPVFPSIDGSSTLDPGYFGPNFLLRPVPPPALSIGRNANEVTISWPQPAEGWLLEQTTALSNAPTATLWSQVPFPYVTNDTHISVITNTPAGHEFFRLRKP